MGALSRVFFKVSALNTNAFATRQFQPTIDVNRLVILRNLIRLRHVGIEIIFAMEGACLHSAVQGQSNTHRQLNCLTIEYWQGSRQTKSDGINMSIRFITKSVSTRRKQFSCSCKFHMDF